nr:hypothetical protein Iba_chr02aCG11180 [Ipomoea batatas]GMC66758.1 hypothetical protein Iba_chr02eCG8690 [Ipomoea batatas]
MQTHFHINKNCKVAATTKGIHQLYKSFHCNNRIVLNKLWQLSWCQSTMINKFWVICQLEQNFLHLSRSKRTLQSFCNQFPDCCSSASISTHSMIPQKVITIIRV